MFFKSIIVTVGLLAKTAVAELPTCPTQYVRREFRELINQDGTAGKELQDYIDGCLCLMKAKGTTGSMWDDFSKVHYNAAAPYHGTASFLPWYITSKFRHRLYLQSLEAAMRKCTGNPAVYIPYWDNGLDSQAPELSLIWQYFGSDGVADGSESPDELEYGYCVKDGPFKDMRFVHSRRANNNLTTEPDCLRRVFGTDTGEKASICTPEVIDMASIVVTL